MIGTVHLDVPSNQPVVKPGNLSKVPVNNELPEIVIFSAALVTPLVPQ